jgi:hypothetical protein
MVPVPDEARISGLGSKRAFCCGDHLRDFDLERGRFQRGEDFLPWASLARQVPGPAEVGGMQGALPPMSTFPPLASDLGTSVFTSTFPEFPNPIRLTSSSPAVRENSVR